MMTHIVRFPAFQLLMFRRQTYSILRRSAACMFPQAWVSNNILSPSLSGNRWNQIKTVENKGNAFESHGLTELDVSHTSYNTVEAV